MNSDSTISPTTFEQRLRSRLLDLLYAQWFELGVPFAVSLRADEAEVIDPEALLWCSLEFLPTDARLREGVVSWLDANNHIVVRQRLRRVAVANEPRTAIWGTLSRTEETADPDTPCHGLDTPAQVTAFCDEIEGASSSREPWTGLPRPGSPTLLLQSRNLLGSDARHLLLVYLLASPSGAPLRNIASWSGYSYRSLADTVGRWGAAGVVELQHGFCRLSSPEPWRALLQLERDIVVIDWFAVFDALVRVLRTLATPETRALPINGTVLSAFRSDAVQILQGASHGEARSSRGSLSYLAGFISQSQRSA